MKQTEVLRFSVTPPLTKKQLNKPYTFKPNKIMRFDRHTNTLKRDGDDIISYRSSGRGLAMQLRNVTFFRNFTPEQLHAINIEIALLLKPHHILTPSTPSLPPVLRGILLFNF